MQKSSAQQIIIVFFVFAFGFFGYIYYSYQQQKKEDAVSVSAPRDCSNATGAYSSGYSSGKTSRMLGGSSSGKSYADKYNYDLGRDVLTADDCFCEGFDDGYYDRPEKYK